jgi:hypothetical protein
MTANLTINRRQFMQIIGISLLGSLPHDWNLPIPAPLFGRALRAAAVLTQPDEKAVIVRWLWPDSVVAIQPWSQTWYRVPGGYVHSADFQPLTSPPQLTDQVHKPPFWGEVTLPAAAVRRWCAADAPLVTRIGHGGAARVVDYLPDTIGWYGITDSADQLLGWSPANAWQPARIAETPTTLTLHLDIQTQTLTVKSDDSSARIRISAHPLIPAGTYRIWRGAIGSQHQLTATDTLYHGVPWNFHFGENEGMYGAYWHNQFGQAASDSGVQMTPYAARWLYAKLGPASQLTVQPLMST